MADIKEQLLDNKGHDAITTHLTESDEMVNTLEERMDEKGVELEVVADEDRDIKMPLRVLYEQEKLDYGRMPVWYLQALGSMTIKEYNAFVKSNSDRLNINEIAASDLLQGVIAKDAVAVARFWDLQKTLLKSKNVVQQVNNISITQDTAIKNLMDDIQEGLFTQPQKSLPRSQKDNNTTI